MKKLITKTSMNYLEISSYIEAKKKSKAYFDQELHSINTLTAHLRAQKHVKCYNNFYYIDKRSIFLFLVILSLFIVIRSFMDEPSYQNYFTETTTVDSIKIEQVISKLLRQDIQNCVSTEVYNYSLYAGRILFILTTLLLLYAARPTLLLYLKNKLTAYYYYYSNLSIMEVYKKGIQKQNFESELLTKMMRNLKAYVYE